MDKDILKQYAAYKQLVKEYEDEMEILKPQIMSMVAEANPTDFEIEVEGVGRFVNVQKRKYVYSAEITAMEDQVKQLKKEQEAKGTAEYTLQPYLKFESAKIE